MPIYVEKNRQYVPFAEISVKMRQCVKYAAIAYLHKTDMPTIRHLSSSSSVATLRTATATCYFTYFIHTLSDI